MLDALVMDMATAESLRQQTEGRRHQLNPRAIDAGPYAGQFFLPARLVTDPRFSEIEWDGVTEHSDFDPTLAWPEPATSA